MSKQRLGRISASPAFRAEASACPWKTDWLTFEITDPSDNGGAGRDRTDDILLAKQVLSQLSYSPVCQSSVVRGQGSGKNLTTDYCLLIPDY